MHTKTLSTLSCIILCMHFFGTIAIPFTSANPIAINIWNVGTILPSLIPSPNISMVDADVLIDVNSEEFMQFPVTFSGDYTFFNHNDTLEALVIAPFDDNYANISENLSIKVNGGGIPFTVIPPYFVEPHEYREVLMMTLPYACDTMALVLANITFTGYDETTISYSFSTIHLRYYRTNDLRISYEVQTGRAWLGNVNERVEFKITGKQPFQYTQTWTSDTSPEIVYGRDCVIEPFDEGRSYIWEWDDEEISEHTGSLYVGFKGKRFNVNSGIVWSIALFIVLPILVVIGLGAGIIIVLKKKKQKEEFV